MEDNQKVKIKTKDIEMASVIGKHTKDQLSSFCRRLGIYVEDGWDKEVLALTMRDALTERPELLLMLYQKEMIYFLLGIWESKEIDMDTSDWALIHQLQLFGLVDYIPREENQQHIYVVKEAKDVFYFYLKSKTAKRLMNKYEEWQSVLRGMMTYYGMISFQRLYFLFCKHYLEPIDDEDLHLFLSARISFLSIGTFVVERHSNMEYYQNYEVSDPEKTLNESLKNYEIKYRLPKMEELIYTGNNDGIGSWDGIGELAEILLNRMELEYYRAVILVKSSILFVQNGETYDQLEEQFFAWCEDAVSYSGEIKKALRLLYDSVPVYHFRGWSRKELRKKEKKSTDFKIIYGGKKEKGGEDS